MIAFAFTFPASRYHATPWGRHANEADVAWPPEPVRILRALIATWWRKGDRERFPESILDDLIDGIAAEPPHFHLPDAVHTHTRAFMPAPTQKKLIFDAFLRFDRGAEVIVVWPDVMLTVEQKALAAHLLKRIGYLGRSESWAEGRIADDWHGEPNSCPRSSKRALSPDVVSVDVAASLTASAWNYRRAKILPDLESMAKAKRAAIAGTLPERLSAALAVDTGQWHKAGWSSPPPVRQIVYDRPPIGPLPRLPRGPQTRLVSGGLPGVPEVARFVLAGRPRPRVEESLKIAEIARWALIRSEDGVQTPPELLGRDANGPLRDDPEHAHAFYLPEDADGDGAIDHLIVYCRKGFSDEARRRLDRLNRLWLAHGRPDEDGDRGRKEWRLALEDIAAKASFDSSPLLGRACVWTSVTPYLKSRFDKRRPIGFDALVDSYRSQIALEWRRRFPAEPSPTVSPLTDSMPCQRFAARLEPAGVVRSPLAFNRTRSRRGGPQPDAAGGLFKLTFDRPVDGPIAIGWGCHFGLGLFTCRWHESEMTT
ncbi:MAG: type I-U CRISPR-associated protein Cas5/Cas6 [Rhodospirillales bacterium]|nr:type I-U CRISPR-associated protein Cas5/Cas6 [Rhodospirillales bacterium]